MQVRNQGAYGDRVVGDRRNHVRPAQFVTALNQVPSGFDTERGFVVAGKTAERFTQPPVILLEPDVVHPYEQRFAQRGAAESVSVAIRVEHVVLGQLVQELQDWPFIGPVGQAPAKLERRLLALQADALSQGQRGLAERSDPDRQRVAQCRRQLGVRTFDRKRPQACRIADDLFRGELAADLDGVERASRAALVQPLGEPLHVRRVAEQRAHELAHFVGGEARELDQTRVVAQRGETDRDLGRPAQAFGRDQQQRMLGRHSRERRQKAETRVVGVFHVVDLDQQRPGLADLREPSLQRAGALAAGCRARTRWWRGNSGQ